MLAEPRASSCTTPGGGLIELMNNLHFDQLRHENHVESGVGGAVERVDWPKVEQSK